MRSELYGVEFRWSSVLNDASRLWAPEEKAMQWDFAEIATTLQATIGVGVFLVLAARRHENYGLFVLGGFLEIAIPVLWLACVLEGAWLLLWFWIIVGLAIYFLALRTIGRYFFLQEKGRSEERARDEYLKRLRASVRHGPRRVRSY